MIHGIGENHMCSLKITAVEPSSVMRNAAELKEALLKKYGAV